MGLLDQLGGAVLKSVVGQLESSVLPSVLSEVLGAGGQGGLSAIVVKLEQSGMGEVVKSWLGSGENLPISTDQLKSALDNEQVKQLAEKFGIPVNDVLGTLASMLPETVDKASPNGTLEEKA